MARFEQLRSGIHNNRSSGEPSSERTSSFHLTSSSSGSQVSNASSARRKAAAKAAAAKKQAEFEKVIADKQRDLRKLEIATELRRVDIDHDMAVLEAEKKDAMASAELLAIEEVILEEEGNTRALGNLDGGVSAAGRTGAWVKEQSELCLIEDALPRPAEANKINFSRNPFMVEDTENSIFQSPAADQAPPDKEQIAKWIPADSASERAKENLPKLSLDCPSENVDVQPPSSHASKHIEFS